MNLPETIEAHSMIMYLDDRVQPFDDNGEGAKVWHTILQDVPFNEMGNIIRRLYSRPQMLVLQPGHIVEAWETIHQERAARTHEQSAPCPAHPWDHATNCKACWSEIKTGQRTKDHYGKPQAA